MAPGLSKEELSQRMRDLVFGGQLGPAQGKAITFDIVREDTVSILFIAALISLQDCLHKAQSLQGVGITCVQLHLEKCFNMVLGSRVVDIIIGVFPGDTQEEVGVHYFSIMKYDFVRYSKPGALVSFCIPIPFILTICVETSTPIPSSGPPPPFGPR